MNTPEIFRVFEAAAAHKQDPTLVFGTVTIKFAPADGANPGALYIYIREHYVGKILPDGRFFAKWGRPASKKLLGFARKVTFETTKHIVEFGQWSEKCACCHRKLTDPESIERGVGPVCAKKWGLAA